MILDWQAAEENSTLAGDASDLFYSDNDVVDKFMNCRPQLVHDVKKY